MKFFIRQIIFAFQFLKINKLIHLDFKPENILIGANFQIKVTDFSLTKKINNNDLKAGKITLKNGTTCYMGKEYYTNNRQVNIENVYKIDYFGMGCILYLMIFREHLIKPNQKKYTLEEINKFIENGIKKINENKIISDELKELLINLIGDIEKRKNIEELLDNKWAFPEKKVFIRNKENNKVAEFNNYNCKNLINNKILEIYEFDEIKELNKLETIYGQDVMALMLNLNINDNINKIKKNPLFYQHRKKFIFKK